MHHWVSPHRGPGPRLAPLGAAERLVIVAWVQLGFVALCTAAAAMVAIMLASSHAAALACFDPSAGCDAPGPSKTEIALHGGAWIAIVAGAMLAVVAAHLHRRGRVPAYAVAAALGSPLLTALAGARLFGLLP